MWIARHGILQSGRGVGVTPPLDIYTGAAAAYSLRKIRSAYTGFAIRVRRTDNTEQDIGFDGSGNLNESALLSFAGTSDTFITTWYDQSGNGRNLAQTTNSNQPIITQGQSIFKENNKPTINFGTQNSAWFFRFPTGFLNAATTLSYFHVARITDYSGSNSGILGPQGSNSVGLEILQHTVISRRSLLRINGTIRNDNSGTAYQLWDNDINNIVSILGNSSSVSAFKNNASVTLTNSNALPSLNFNGIYNLGNYASTQYAFMKMQELIIYTSDQSSNRSGINSNINSYYSIY